MGSSTLTTWKKRLLGGLADYRYRLGVPTTKLDEYQRRYPFPAQALARIKKRRWILEYAKKEGIGAEIGVFRGHFTEQLFLELQPRRLYLIDPWLSQGEFFGWGGAYTNFNSLPTAVAYEEVALRSANYPSTDTTMIQGFFEDVVDQINEPLDWAYLDAKHLYESSLADLRTLKTLLKDDGVILGDDWNPNPSHVHHGVFRAVQQFVMDEDFQIVAAGPASQFCLKRRLKY